MLRLAGLGFAGVYLRTAEWQCFCCSRVKKKIKIIEYEDLRGFGPIFLHGDESVADAYLWRVFSVVGVGDVLYSYGNALDGDSGGFRHHMHLAYGVYSFATQCKGDY